MSGAPSRGAWRAVARFELRALVASPAHVVAWLSLVLLLAHGVAAGRARLAAERADRELIAELDRRTLAAHADEHRAGLEPDAAFALRLRADPHWIGLRYGVRHAILPVLPSAVLAAPDDPLAVDAVRVSTARLDLEGRATTTANPTLLALGPLDLEFVLVWWLPLVVLALAWGLLSEERERGTAVLLAASPVSTGALLLGKALPRFAVLFVPCAVAVALAVRDAPDALVRGGATAAAVALSIVLWLCVAALVNLSRLSSASCALTLAGAWLVSVVGLPAAARAAAAVAVEAPSAAMSVAVEREARHAAEVERSRLLDAYLADHPELSERAREVGVAEYKQAFWATEARVDEALAPLEEERRTAAARRARVERALDLLSPATALAAVVEGAAGRDARRRAAFEEAVRAHHARWREWFRERTYETTRLEPRALEGAPSFEWVEPAPAALVHGVRAPLVALAVQALVALASCVALRNRWRPVERSAEE